MLRIRSILKIVTLCMSIFVSGESCLVEVEGIADSSHDTGAQNTNEDDLELLRDLQADHDLNRNDQDENIGQDCQPGRHQILEIFMVANSRHSSVPVFVDWYACEDRGE